MLETIMNSYAIFWVLGVIILMGAISKLTISIALTRLVKAAGKMGKSTHKLMKLVKAKFEHTYMLSNGVDNIGAFVDKYLYEYKVLGFRLHSWRYFEKQTMWTSAIVGCIGATICYRQNGMQEMMFQYGAFAAVGVVLLFLICNSTDEEHELNATRIYMIDYPENICAPRYQKQQELQYRKMEKTVEEAAVEEEREVEETIISEMKMETVEPEVKPQEEEPKVEKKVPQEVILREILEEFLA